MSSAEVGGSRPADDFTRAARWNLLGSAWRQGITLSATFLLVVLLEPADFGTASVALAVVLLWQTAVQQGFLPLLVARPRLSQVELTTVHWFVVGCGVLGSALTVAAAGPAAALAGAPALAGALHALAAFVLVESLAVPHEAVVRRAMDGRGLAVRGVLAPTCGAAAGVTAALLGAGLWALVGQQLVISVTNLVVLVVRSGWRPSGRPRWCALRTFAGPAWRSGAAGLGQALDARTDLLVVGLVLGPASAGLYRLAGRLVDAAHDVTCRAFVTVSLAELGRTDDLDLARRARDILERTVAVSGPALGLLAGSAAGLTGVIGPEWVGAAPALALLCLSSLLTSATSTLVPLLQRRGRLGRVGLLAWAGATAGLGLFGAVTGVVEGLPPATALALVAAGRVVLQVGEAAAAVLAVRGELGVGMRELLPARTVRHCAAAVVVAAVSWGAAAATPDGAAPSLVLVVSVLAGGVAALLALLSAPQGRHALRRATAGRRTTAARTSEVTAGSRGGDEDAVAGPVDAAAPGRRRVVV